MLLSFYCCMPISSGFLTRFSQRLHTKVLEAYMSSRWLGGHWKGWLSIKNKVGTLAMTAHLKSEKLLIRRRKEFFPSWSCVQPVHAGMVQWSLCGLTCYCPCHPWCKYLINLFRIWNLFQEAEMNSSRSNKVLKQNCLLATWNNSSYNKTISSMK